ALDDPEYLRYREANELPPQRLALVRRFFQDYKQLEGLTVEVDEFEPAATSWPIIDGALLEYSERRRRGFLGA
ncbi:MAG: inorganic diphosphatase, partial [Planctomycetaceae bacterium]